MTSAPDRLCSPSAARAAVSVVYLENYFYTTFTTLHFQRSVLRCLSTLSLDLSEIKRCRASARLAAR